MSRRLGEGRQQLIEQFLYGSSHFTRVGEFAVTRHSQPQLIRNAVREVLSVGPGFPHVTDVALRIFPFVDPRVFLFEAHVLHFPTLLGL